MSSTGQHTWNSSKHRTSDSLANSLAIDTITSCPDLWAISSLCFLLCTSSILQSFLSTATHGECGLYSQGMEVYSFLAFPNCGWQRFIAEETVASQCIVTNLLTIRNAYKRSISIVFPHPEGYLDSIKES